MENKDRVIVAYEKMDQRSRREILIEAEKRAIAYPATKKLRLIVCNTHPPAKYGY